MKKIHKNFNLIIIQSSYFISYIINYFYLLKQEFVTTKINIKSNLIFQKHYFVI